MTPSPVIPSFRAIGSDLSGAMRPSLSSPSVLLVSGVLVAVFGLDLSFRTRELGESGLDPQNGAKFAAWVLMLATAMHDRAAIVAILRRDFALHLLLAFAVFALASAFWSPVPVYSAATAIGLFSWLGFALVLAKRLPVATFVTTLVVALACEVGLALIGAIVVPDIAWMPPSEGETGYRLQGFSGHANLLAEHAGILLIFSLGAHELGLLGRLKLGRLTLFALIGMSLVALYGTNSRTAMIATAMAVVLPVFRRSRLLPIYVALSLSLAALLIWLKALDRMPDASSFGLLTRSGSSTEIATLTGRTDLWEVAWRHFLERPLLGWGFNGTERLMADSMELNFPGNPVNAHNMVLQGLMSLGVIGFTPALTFFLILLGRFVVRPDGLRDRLVIFVLVLGSAEAECMTVPTLLSFLIFWCMARDANAPASRIGDDGIGPRALEPHVVPAGRAI